MPGLKQVFVSALTEHTTVAKDSLGDIRQEGKNVYKYVKYVTNTALLAGAVGSVCYYKDAAGYVASEVMCDLSDSAGNLAAGVLMGILAINEYGWIQIKGHAVCTTNAAAGAVGNAMCAIGGNDRSLDVSALVTDAIVATLLSTTSGAQIINADFPY